MQKFKDIIKKKEELMTEVYLSEKDLFTEAKRYISTLQEIFAEL